MQREMRMMNQVSIFYLFLQFDCSRQIREASIYSEYNVIRLYIYIYTESKEYLKVHDDW